MRFHGLPAAPRAPVFLQIDLKDVTITLKDAGVNSIDVKIGEGNLTYTESRNVEYTLNRGLLDEVRLGDEIPMDVTLDFTWEFIIGNTDSAGVPPTVEDALKQQNNASVWVSTDTDLCRPFAVDILLDHMPACGTGDQEEITLQDFRYDTLEHDLRAGTVAVTGRCNVTNASIVRFPNT